MNERHWIDANREAIERFSSIDGPKPVCMVAGCDRSPLVHDLCKQHYRSAQRFFGPKGSAAR